jgi:hypothetical protein
MQTDLSFSQAFFGIVFRPVATLRQFETARRPFWQGMLALLLVIIAYTVILGVFITRGYPAAALSVLPLSVEETYRYQIWFQGPLFLVDTLALAGLLLLMARFTGRRPGFSVAFARASFATSVPFVFTTMLVELVLAGLLLANVVQPDQALAWLTGAGIWFATTYQLIGLVWIVALLAVATWLSTGLHWSQSVGVGALLTVIYGIPIGLFIR